jgi:hypothetical protein
VIILAVVSTATINITFQIIYILTKSSVLVVPQCDSSHFSYELLFKVVSVVDFALVKVEQEQKERCDEIALDLYVLDALHIKEDVSVDLNETKEDTQNF